MIRDDEVHDLFCNESSFQKKAGRIAVIGGQQVKLGERYGEPPDQAKRKGSRSRRAGWRRRLLLTPRALEKINITPKKTTKN